MNVQKTLVFWRKPFVICRTDVTRSSTWLSIFDLQMVRITGTHKKRNQVILKALWLLVPYDPNPTNHLGRCVILLMQNTPLNSTVSHSLQDVCDRKRANLLLDLSWVLLQLTCIFRHKLFVASIPMICSSILLTYVRQLTWICNKFTIGRIVGAER